MRTAALFELMAQARRDGVPVTPAWYRSTMCGLLGPSSVVALVLSPWMPDRDTGHAGVAICRVYPVYEERFSGSIFGGEVGEHMLLYAGTVRSAMATADVLASAAGYDVRDPVTHDTEVGMPGALVLAGQAIVRRLGLPPGW